MFGMGRLWNSADMSGCKRLAAGCLNELVEKGVIEKDWTADEVKQGNKIVEIKYDISPTDWFIKQQKKSNKHAILLSKERGRIESRNLANEILTTSIKARKLAAETKGAQGRKVESRAEQPKQSSGK